MSQENNNNKHFIVEAITRSIARIAQEYDNLCICCNDYRSSPCVSKEEKGNGETEVSDPNDPQSCTQPYLFSLQSEESGDVETHATAYFIDAESGESVKAEASVNSVATVDSTEDLTLGEFLARPITIDTFTWQTSDPVGTLQSVVPWQAFMSNASVKRKLENYAFLRAKLHVKVMINATPFQYGTMRILYQPMDGLLTRKFRGTAASQLVSLSQLPGFYIYPTSNAGGEMELPFVYHKNWLDITSDQDVEDFGRLFYTIYSSLDVAISGGPSTVTVRTLAWMTDVELMGTTGKLTLQSDEYGEGAISKPATAISNFAGYLTNIPIIGKFARATQIGAGAVSRIASIFGFTNVPNIETVHAFYPMSAPQLATAEISVPYQKLALDPKTELSIDPTPFGVKGEDQLALSYLKTRESYFGTTLWSTTDVVGDLLLSTRVTPDLKISEDIVGLASAVVGKRTYMTPLSHIGALFENWRGSIKFRFKVIGTKYHKGRLKICFDPLHDISVDNIDTNLAYSHIMDLGESGEVTITVPYHQALGWLRVDTNSSLSNWDISGLAPRAGSDNGSISIRVYTALEAPVSSVVRVLAFVSAGDDFEFANPSGSLVSEGTAKLPSLFALQSEDIQNVHFGTPVNPDEERYGLNFGESIHSLRKLMHRMSVVDTVPLNVGVGSAYNLYRKGLLRMPYTPGYISGGFSTTAAGVITAGAKGYAFNSMHTMPWVSSLFLGYRGSTNFCVTVNSPKLTLNDIRFIRTTDTGALTVANRFVSLQSSILGSASLSVKTAGLDVVNFNRNGLAGMAMTSAIACPSGLFNLPDYNNFNFSLCNPSAYLEGEAADGTDRQGVVAYITTANTTATDEMGYTTLITATGAGPDFTCIYYCCTPTIDWQVGDPVPTP